MWANPPTPPKSPPSPVNGNVGQRMEQMLRSKGKRRRVRKPVDYEKYLQSDHWAEVRRQYWDDPKTPKCCFICGDTGWLDLHHRSYAHLGREDYRYLVPLCRDCHDDVHDWVNREWAEGRGRPSLLRQADRWLKICYEKGVKPGPLPPGFGSRPWRPDLEIK